MSKQIKTYQQMLEEKERLENLLKSQKSLIRQDIQQLKGELKPAIAAVSMVGRIFKRDHSNPILDTTANSLIDLVLKKIILARAGFIPRLILPLFAKNVSSQYISKHKNELLKKLFSFMGHRNGKHKADEKTKTVYKKP